MAEKRIVVLRFDRDPLYCRSVVARLRALNPGVPIHGLYGAGPGLRERAVRLGARPVLGLDGCYSLRHEGRWNWRNGDLALLEWYREVGRRLDFDIVHLLEWDVLLLVPLAQAYAAVPPGAVGLTCLTPASSLAGRWEWLREPERVREWEGLLAHARTQWGHAAEPLACLGVGPVLPRAFLDAYAALEPTELGHDELRLPLAAHALGFPLVDTGFRRSWDDPAEDRWFNVGGPLVTPATVAAEAADPAGRRVFHPVRPLPAERRARPVRGGRPVPAGGVAATPGDPGRPDAADLGGSAGPARAGSAGGAGSAGRVASAQVAAAFVERAANKVLRAGGYRVGRIPPREPADLPPASVGLFREVGPYTMTSPEAVYALESAIRHVSAQGVSGAIVECGVWRGGSMMAAARTLLDLGRSDVDLYLFDTFEGMPAPTDKDVRFTGESAEHLLVSEDGKDAEMLWARAPLDQVRTAMARTGYPESRIHYIVGKVEETLPDAAPERISMLRLDTDWYESSRHELLHLYPRLSPGGVLLLDDYAWWNGVRTAVDEYFAEHPPRPFLVRIDDSGARIAVKPDN
jgi:O-methyltransferase